MTRTAVATPEPPRREPAVWLNPATTTTLGNSVWSQLNIQTRRDVTCR